MNMKPATYFAVMITLTWRTLRIDG